MASCSYCESTDINTIVMHLAEVKERSATHDESMAKLEQEYNAGTVGVFAVQQAYKVADQLDAEIEYLEDKIAAMRRIEARRQL